VKTLLAVAQVLIGMLLYAGASRIKRGLRGGRGHNSRKDWF
jgi:hypothetical protein